ncbi:hypothetical protein RB195_015968 [Necator americanus]|uniref:SCP domain-containing protein n=1 Tax=Necator americanus TaxID=51031 RepID=A0ABR1E6Z6_NECAM
MASARIFTVLLCLCCVTLHTSRAQTSPPTNNICPNNTGMMNDEARNLILQTHNQRRTTAARGEVKNGKKTTRLPRAANMMEMKYDCNLETSAQTYANTCTLTASPEGQRAAQGENIATVTGSVAPVEAVRQAENGWWNQISINGMNEKMLFTQYLSTKSRAPIAFTQMVWALSYRLGCGVATCATSTFVVCRYGERGNIINQNVYTTGAPCSNCPSGCTTGGVLCTSPTVV